MAEMVIRTGKRRKKGMLDQPERRWPISAAQAKGMMRAAAEAAPGLLLGMADVVGIPSGFHAAYLTALAALDKPVSRPVYGAVAAILLRWISGMTPRWEGLITLALIWLAPVIVHGRGNGVMMVFTALIMAPTAIIGSLAPTGAQMLTAWASPVISGLSAPLMYRALKGMYQGSGTAHHMDSMEERVCAAFFAALLICGGGRLLILGVNAGGLLASVLVLMASICLGTGAGCASGMVAGLSLALQGLPLTLAVAMGMGGFLGGAIQALGRRRLTCAAFGLGTLLAAAASGAAGIGCGASVLMGAAAVALLPARHMERCHRFFRRFLNNYPVPGDAYATSMLTSWERTMDAMAMAVPLPCGLQEARTPQWWESKLCAGCPEMAMCGCMRNEFAADKAEMVWDCREADDAVWGNALEELRGIGCRRLYFLQQSMDALRREDAIQRRSIRRASYQRDMLITHLTAVSGAARRFAMLSTGENWWDEISGRRIRRALSDHAVPARLSWVRRIQGHVQAAFELQFITGARRQAQELCGLLSELIGAPVEITRVDGDRVQLAERPLMTVACAAASASIGSESSEASCGDTAWTGRLQDGRWMAALSDGMGHGDAAALASRETVELLRLCLDAGYTREQTLTAVNGMMLMSGHGERFTTVDLLTVDLWSGEAALDKLGAAGSWLLQSGTLHEISGNALPLGILENIESRTCCMHLAPGDAVVLISDGVEEAFPDASMLENAIWEALAEESTEAAAKRLLDAAARFSSGQRLDDQSVVFVRLESADAVQSAPLVV